MRWLGLFVASIGLMLSDVALAVPNGDAEQAYARGDYATAFKIWFPLAEQGSVQAQRNIARMYERGEWVAQDSATGEAYRFGAHVPPPLRTGDSFVESADRIADGAGAKRRDAEEDHGICGIALVARGIAELDGPSEMTNRFLGRPHFEEDPAEEELAESAEAHSDLEKQLEDGFSHELFEMAMNCVKNRVQPATWKAFHLTAVEGLSGAAAAAKLQIPVGNVFVAKHRVQKMLQEEIHKLDATS